MKRIILVTLMAFLLTSCGGRLPSPKTAHKVLVKHFQKYGKKYRQSDFGKYTLQRVEIYEVSELQKNRAEVLAYTHLEGDRVYPVRVTLQKKPFGWRSVAWENLGGP